MNMRPPPFARTLIIFALFVFHHAALAQQTQLQRREFLVDGVKREALLHVPAKRGDGPMPLIFGFHGHGGTMNSSARQYHFHTLWPEAVVIYPQGLNTPGRLTDPEGKKPGWQSRPGDQGDRDLKFFDTMLATLSKEFKIDDKRIYSSGHSNGGGFTYLLWSERGDKFAAFGPSAAAPSSKYPSLKPKPIIHVAGENDPLVKFEWQKATIEAVKKINQCSEGKAWELDAKCTFYPSAIGAPLVTAVHPGTHSYPDQAPAAIVKFFKSQVKK